MLVDSFFYKVDLDTKDIAKKSKNIDTSNMNLVNSFNKIKVAALAVTAGVGVLVSLFAKTRMESYKLADAIGLSKNKLENFRFSVEKFGDQGKDADNILRNLSNNLGSFKRIGEGINFEALSQLGVSLYDSNSNLKTSEQLLYDVADAVSQIQDPNLAREFERAILGSDALHETIKRGSKALKEQSPLIKILGKNFLESNKLTIDSFTAIKTELKSSFEAFSTLFLDGLIKNINKVLKLTKVLVNAFTVSFRDLSNIMGGTENTVLALSAGVAVLARRFLLLFAPAIIAGTAFYAILDDITSFFQGKDSFTGDIFGFFGVQAQDVIGWISKIKEAWRSLIEYFRSDSFTSGLDKFIELLSSLYKNISGIVEKGIKQAKENFTFDFMPELNLDRKTLQPIPKTNENKTNNITINVQTTTNASASEIAESTADRIRSYIGS